MRHYTRRFLSNSPLPLVLFMAAAGLLPPASAQCTEREDGRAEATTAEISSAGKKSVKARATATGAWAVKHRKQLLTGIFGSFQVQTHWGRSDGGDLGERLGEAIGKRERTRGWAYGWNEKLIVQDVAGPLFVHYLPAWGPLDKGKRRDATGEAAGWKQLTADAVIWKAFQFTYMRGRDRKVERTFDAATMQFGRSLKAEPTSELKFQYKIDAGALLCAIARCPEK